ncbi:MAG: peptidylprolyl isomerase [Candidatus Gastranaerophilales bacterium]
MNTKKLLVTLAASVMLLSGCGKKEETYVIKVNDTQITKTQFDQAFELQAKNGILARLGFDVKDGEDSAISLMIKQRVVEELIVKSLIEEEMTKRELKATNEEVEEAIKEIIEQLGSKEQLDKVLKANGIGNDEFKKSVGDEVRMKKLIEQLGDYEISDEDAKKYYDENTSKFTHPATVRASHILISANPDEIKEIIKSEPENIEINEEELKAKIDEQMKEKEAKTKELLAKTKANPASFGRFAKENSDDTTSAIKGGDLGFFSEAEMVPEFSKAAFSLKPNTIYETIVKTPYGYHIILVTDRQEAGTDEFEKVSTDIKDYLKKQKQIKSMDDLVESMKKTAKIKYIQAEYDPEKIAEIIKSKMKQEKEDAKKEREERKTKNKEAKAKKVTEDAQPEVQKTTEPVAEQEVVEEKTAE